MELTTGPGMGFVGWVVRRLEIVVLWAERKLATRYLGFGSLYY